MTSCQGTTLILAGWPGACNIFWGLVDRKHFWCGIFKWSKSESVVPLTVPLLCGAVTCVMCPGNPVVTVVKESGGGFRLTGKCQLLLACSRACASKVFSLRADCGRVIVYPGLKQWERPRHNIFGVCTRLAGGVCMSTSANSSASKHLTVTKIVWKIVYVTFDYLISHFFKILSLEFMANLFRDFRASVSLKVFHYRLRGKWCQYDLEIN